MTDYRLTGIHLEQDTMRECFHALTLLSASLAVVARHPDGDCRYSLHLPGPRGHRYDSDRRRRQRDALLQAVESPGKREGTPQLRAGAPSY